MDSGGTYTKIFANHLVMGKKIFLKQRKALTFESVPMWKELNFFVSS